MQDEIITRLAKIGDLKVISRTSTKIAGSLQAKLTYSSMLFRRRITARSLPRSSVSIRCGPASIRCAFPEIGEQHPVMPPEERQLAAIMFTDMVGYSALAQRDEALALDLLEEHRELFERFWRASTAPRSKRSATLSCSNSEAHSKQCNVRSRFSGHSRSAITTSWASAASS